MAAFIAVFFRTGLVEQAHCIAGSIESQEN